ncbi:MAG: methylated-DNA--[protein]-cysteine S-methyltransferase [Microbacterium sp.]|uniref:methylated-DNA--[protein]-cysteine S-methyltransferase n=1 Tax=Microbacterium sp. TaxID=51671 RepID=UPI0039E328E1
MTWLRFGTEPTPIGTAVIAVTDEGLVALEITEAPPELVLEPAMHRLAAVAEHDPVAVEPVARQLREYFDGERAEFDIAIDWRLVRGFTRAALEAVCRIPYGETASYGEVAVWAGAPRAARAVGTACATTPISVVVPVHRVVRSDGSLGAYGARPELKRFLVNLERAIE